MANAKVTKTQVTFYYTVSC